jgi:hypothetical protein
MESSLQPDGEQLLRAARVPSVVVAAAIALAASGLLIALVGVQNLSLVTWRGSWVAFPYALLAVGVLSIFVAAKLHRARAWSLPVGLALAIVQTLATAGFFLLSFGSGLLSLLGALAVPGALVALTLTSIAWRPFRELIALRRELRRAGFDLDL